MKSVFKGVLSYQTTFIILAFRFLRFPRRGAAFQERILSARPNNRCQSRFFSSYQSRIGRTIHQAEFSTSTEASDEDLARWEQMYEAGQTEDSSDGLLSDSSMTRSEVRVVTFDLDNTLWKTSACIDAANNALAAHLDNDKIVQPIRVEKIMGELFQADKSKYAPLDADQAKAPVLLTELRIDAICQVLEDHNGYSSDDARAYAKNAFQVWTQARHDAIPNHLANNVEACLERLSTIQTSIGESILIGAITDGNSDPRNVDSLRDYFDFCVNAEQIGVGKPDKRVYLEAIKQVVAHPSFTDLKVANLESDEELENAVGPYWVHIGDDFVKDIVAAKSLKMRSVWATELVRDKINPKQTVAGGEERDLDAFLKDVSESPIIKMSIGADSYLADSLMDEYVDAVAEEFHELSTILLEWHADGQGVASMTTAPDENAKLASALEDIEKIANQQTITSPSAQQNDILSVVTPDNVVMEQNGPAGIGAAPENVVLPRAFRIIREGSRMDIPAPLLDRGTRTMKEVMTMAQMDKSSGVFSFPADDVQALRDGRLVLMVKIGGTDLQFSREIFVGMTVQEVLDLADENPVELTLYMKEAADSPAFDLF